MRRQHTPQGGVQNHQRDGAGQHAHRRQRFGLQGRGHVQYPLDQQGQSHEQRGGACDRDQPQCRKPGAHQRCLLGRRVGRHAFGQGAGQRGAHAQVEHAEHANQRQPKGEQTPALYTHQMQQPGGQQQRHDKRQATPQRIPEHTGKQASARQPVARCHLYCVTCLRSPWRRRQPDRAGPSRRPCGPAPPVACARVSECRARAMVGWRRPHQARPAGRSWCRCGR